LSRAFCFRGLPLDGTAPAQEKTMTHRFSVGQQVHFAASFRGVGSGVYKIVRQLPVENDRAVRYRIKSVAEAFERIAEEGQLSRST
jgi:hypothetical protein